MIYGVVLGIHVLVCLGLVLVVLLQSSKGGGLAGAFGGGAESTVFGGRGAATVLSKATTVFGAAFMLTSLTLTLMSAGHGRSTTHSVVADEAARVPLGAPATGTAPPTGELPAAPDAGAPAAGAPSAPGTAPGGTGGQTDGGNTP